MKNVDLLKKGVIKSGSSHQHRESVLNTKHLLFAGLIAAGAASAQSNFSMYGFMDAEFQKRLNIKENNVLLQESFISERPQLFLGNVNLYLDFTPNEMTRALVELGVNSADYDEAATLDGYLGTVKFESTGDPAVDGLTQMLEGQVNPTAGTTRVSEGRDKKEYGGISIERAWVDLSFMENMTLKVGKFITPAGIWNVDHGSPIITTVSQPNQTDFFPIFPISQTGLMLYGQEYLGDHELVWNAYTSTGRSGDDNYIEEFNDLGAGYKLSFLMDVLDGIRLGTSGYGGTIKSSDEVFHINYNFTAEDAGALATAYGTVLAQGGTEEQAQGAVKLAFQELMGSATPDPSNFSYPVNVVERAHEFVWGLEAKVEVEGLTLQGEFNTRKITNDVDNEAATTYQAFYGLLSYSIPVSDNISITPYTMFEQITWEDPVKNLTSRELTFIPLEGWNSFWLGLNTSFWGNYRLKLEYQMATLLMADQPNFPMGNLKQGDMDLDTFSGQITVAF